MNKKKSLAAIEPRKAPKQERSRQTYQVILQGAAAIIRKDGIKKLSTNRVAEESGVSIGSLYQYFPSKAAIIAALIDQTLEAEFETLKETLSQDAKVIGARQMAHRIFSQYYRCREKEFDYRQSLVSAVPIVEKSNTTLKFHHDVAGIVLEYFRKNFPVEVAHSERQHFVLQYILKGVILSSVDDRVQQMDRSQLAADFAELFLDLLKIPEDSRGAAI